jgi:hypothetical protein
MEQLGCILLGFAVVAPAVYAVREIIMAGEESRPIRAIPPPVRSLLTPLPRCELQAGAEYFGSWLQFPNNERPQPLSIPELTDLLAGPSAYAPPAGVRFDSEGGYRLRL